MSIRISELAVEGSGGEVALRADSFDSDNIRVTWMCGDSREFTKDGLKAAVGYLDKVAKLNLGDIWIALNDRSGRQLVARVDDGRLYVNDRPTDIFEGGNHVDWSTLKKAIRKSL